MIINIQQNLLLYKNLEFKILCLQIVIILFLQFFPGYPSIFRQFIMAARALWRYSNSCEILFIKFPLFPYYYEKKKKEKKIDPSIKEYVGNKRGGKINFTDRGKALFV